MVMGLMIHPKQWKGHQPQAQRREGYRYFFGLKAYWRRRGMRNGRRYISNGTPPQVAKYLRK